MKRLSALIISAFAVALPAFTAGVNATGGGTSQTPRTVRVGGGVGEVPRAPDHPAEIGMGHLLGDPAALALAQLRRDPFAFGVRPADLSELAVASSYRSEHSGVTHVNLGQRFDGLEVFGAYATVNVAEDGEVLFVGDSLVRGLAAGASGRFAVGPRGAVAAAAEGLGLAKPKGLRVLSRGAGAARRTVLSGAGVSEAAIPARLGWQPTRGGLRLAWQLVIDDSSAAHLWNATVDAATGVLLGKDDWTSHDSMRGLAHRLGRAGGSAQPSTRSPLSAPDPVDDGSSYRVFALPTESPNDGPRTLVTNPADAVGSPYGWHDTNGEPGAEYTRTQGNNVHAYLDQDADNAPDVAGAPFRPRSGSQYVFSDSAAVAYKRLTREIAVPDGGGHLSFATSYDTETDWDYLFVEARTPGADDWTTLPDANGHTTQATGNSCAGGWRELHPQLDHYQTLTGGTCTPTGTTGHWHAATGPSVGYQEWSVDLSAWAGATVEVSIAYATDWEVQADGVAIDDVTLPDGTATSFEDGLDGWTVTGPPGGSDPNLNDWVWTDATPVGVTDGGSGLDFDFPLNLNEHAQNNRDAAVTNLVYWNNVVHDVMYRYGFDEASGNFQADNYGRGGEGGDFIRAEAADGGGINNANFASPVESATSGGTPRMQMYLWPGAQFGLPNQVVVDGLGSFGAQFARFTPAPTAAGLSGRLVYAGTGCTAETYPTPPNSAWVAIVDGGTAACAYRTRVQVAQQLGARAVIVAHNTADGPPILSSPLAGPPLEIPAVGVSQADGEAIKAAGSTIATVRKHPDHPGIRDGDLDAGIVIHEYGHGISQRLTGGPTVNCLTGDEQAGEGWSDFFALTMLLDPSVDDPDRPRAMASYALHQGSRSDAGLRPAPYSRNMAVQPFTYDSIKTGGWLDGTSLSLPHGLGHGWAAVLWDMTWDLVDKHGFNPDVYGPWDSGGNNRALRYVIDGLKFQGCSPGLVTARDAIIAAADELSDGADSCTLWASFARRGLGYSAVQGSTDRDDNTEAFDTHPHCQAGFHGGVADEPTLNSVVRGATADMEFDAGGDQGLDILASNSPYSRQVDCETLRTEAPKAEFTTPRPLPVPAETPGGSTLSYDERTGRYAYPWKTLKDWAGTCREFVLTRDDGVQHRAYFRFQATPEFAVTGRVHNADGQLLANATVALDGPVFRKTTTTGADGSYAFDGVPRGTYTATAFAGGCNDSQTRELVVSRPAVVDFTLPRCTTQRVSAASDGGQGDGSSLRPSMSADGRYVAFQSSASSLVPSDTNGVRDVFVYDRDTETIERVSVTDSGTQTDGASANPRISADGRYVAFESAAANLVPADTNGVADVFVHDRVTGTTQRVSVASDGAEANGVSVTPSMSSDGRHVALRSSASNLVPDDTNRASDVFVYDRVTGGTERVSVASGGVQANGSSFMPSIAGDGRHVAFHSTASNLVSADTNGTTDVFLYDRDVGATERVSVASDGTQGSGVSSSPSLSGDGRYVAFQSAASNLVAADTNGTTDVFVRDRDSGTTERVSVATDEAQGNASSLLPSISAGGQHVAFHSLASNLVAGDTNATLDVFVRDRDSGTTERMSVASGDRGEGSGASQNAAVSAEGRYVAFDSFASNLVPGDTNRSMDVFVRDRRATPAQSHAATNPGPQHRRR